MRAFLVAAVVGSACLGLVLACGSESGKESPSELPNRNPGDGEEGGTKEAPDAGVLTCTDRAAVDTRPACDTCAKQNCCQQIIDCDNEPDCRALQDCIEPCDQNDFSCIGLCQLAHPNGSDALLAVGSCVGSKCKADCPPPELDASADAPF